MFSIQSLSTISAQYYDAVAVTFVGVQTKACTIAGTTIQIEFLQDFGPLPLMLGDGSRLTHSYSQLTPSLTITRIVIGTKGERGSNSRQRVAARGRQAQSSTRALTGSPDACWLLWWTRQRTSGARTAGCATWPRACVTA